MRSVIRQWLCSLWLFGLLLSSVALAQAPAPPSSGVSFEAIASLGAVVLVALLGSVFILVWKDDKVRGQRIATVRWCTGLAAQVLDRIAPLTANTVDDKIALALKKFNEAMDAHGFTPTPAETAQALVALQPLALAATLSRPPVVSAAGSGNPSRPLGSP